MFAQMRDMPRPDSPNREIYDYAHYADHLAIVRAIKASPALGQNLILYPIYPRPNDLRTFLQNHQALHDDMNRAVRLVSKRDLTELDPEDDNARNHWAWRNWDQHLAVHRQLGLP